jgi:hypothetical protein
MPQPAGFPDIVLTFTRANGYNASTWALAEVRRFMTRERMGHRSAMAGAPCTSPLKIAADNQVSFVTGTDERS